MVVINSEGSNTDCSGGNESSSNEGNGGMFIKRSRSHMPDTRASRRNKDMTKESIVATSTATQRTKRRY